MDQFLKVLEDEVQLIALAFMAVVYMLRIRWLLKFPASRENTPSRGDERAGIAYAMVAIAMPWAMESARKHWTKYAEFAVFHLGVAVAIAVTFILPYWPGLIAGPRAVVAIQAVLALAFLAGVSRFVKRCVRPDLRLISSADDYFSIILLDLYLLSAFFATPNRSAWALIAFFGMTTFFLIYVPFSKISHHLYFPFQKDYLGKHLGHRGVYPKQTGATNMQPVAK